jgi:hypothetical protein
MIRVAIVLAVSVAHSACSAETPVGNAMVVENAAAVAPRELHRGTDSPMSQTQIVIATDRGQFSAQLVDNETTRALVKILPVTIEMRDHLRQEKTGHLPSPLPELQRQTDFSPGTLGLWGNDDFVIYYRNGRVPEPGIIVLGRVTGDLAKFQDPEPVTVRIERAD